LNENILDVVEILFVDADVNQSAIQIAKTNPPINIPIINPLQHGDQRKYSLSLSLYIYINKKNNL
jgi:hypothetical protein